MLGLANTDLLAEVSPVNVFASWCVACRAEHPLLMQLAREALPSMSGRHRSIRLGRLATKAELQQARADMVVPVRLLGEQ
jgi:thiol-disulfide isomerase/thioredoxin